MPRKRIPQTPEDPEHFRLVARISALTDEILTGSPGTRENIVRLCKHDYKTVSHTKLGTLQELHDLYRKKYKRGCTIGQNLLMGRRQ